MTTAPSPTALEAVLIEAFEQVPHHRRLYSDVMVPRLMAAQRSFSKTLADDIATALEQPVFEYPEGDERAVILKVILRSLETSSD